MHILTWFSSGDRSLLWDNSLNQYSETNEMHFCIQFIMN
jgi:hypothetical protein